MTEQQKKEFLEWLDKKPTFVRVSPAEVKAKFLEIVNSEKND